MSDKTKRDRLSNTKEYRDANPIDRAELQVYDTRDKHKLPRNIVKGLSEALKLRFKGLTYDQIAKITGNAKSAIIGQLKPFEALIRNPNAVNAYVEHEEQFFDAIRLQLVQALGAQLNDPERVKKLDIQRIGWVLGVLFDKMRLIRGKSTQNIAALSKLVMDAHKDVDSK